MKCFTMFRIIYFIWIKHTGKRVDLYWWCWPFQNISHKLSDRIKSKSALILDKFLHLHDTCQLPFCNLASFSSCFFFALDFIHIPTEFVQGQRLHTVSEFSQQGGIWGRSLHSIPAWYQTYDLPVEKLKYKAFFSAGVSEVSHYYCYFPWLSLCVSRSWRRCAGVRRRGYGSWAPSRGSCAASWRRCTVSRRGSSARPARNSWSWRPVWSSSDSRPAPASRGHNASKRPTTLHRYGPTHA